jgi:hypothetical protein
MQIEFIVSFIFSVGMLFQDSRIKKVTLELSDCLTGMKLKELSWRSLSSIMKNYDC